jgi:hypothetical protein
MTRCHAITRATTYSRSHRCDIAWGLKKVEVGAEKGKTKVINLCPHHQVMLKKNGGIQTGIWRIKANGY